jgi:hypothetical protein
MAFVNSTFSDADNRIGWLLSQDQSTVAARAAVQLAIWYTVDNKPDRSLNGFSMSTGNATIANDYDALISFAGYNPSHAYGAQFWQAGHDAANSRNQDLVRDPGLTFQATAVPEPSNFLMGAAGLIFLVAFVNRRREGRWRAAR